MKAEDNKTITSFWKIMQISILRFGFPMFIVYFLIMCFVSLGEIFDGEFPFWDSLFFSFELGMFSGIIFGLIMWIRLKIKEKH